MMMLKISAALALSYLTVSVLFKLKHKLRDHLNCTKQMQS